MKYSIVDNKFALLRDMGINPLSGEGCQLAMRWDTDISPDAAPIVSEFFGGIEFKHSGFNGWHKLANDDNWQPGKIGAFDDNWNLKPGAVVDDGHVMKIPKSVIDDLIIFALLRTGRAKYAYYVEDPYSHNTDILYGDEPVNDERITILRRFSMTGNGANTHEFSGKTIA